VDFRPTPDQQLLVSTARDVLQRHCALDTAPRPGRQRPADAGADDAAGAFDPALWRRMAELGWPGLLVAPALGGTGGSLLDAVLLVEEMGRACLPGPFVGSAVVATTLLQAAGSERQQKRWLPALAGGERIAALALLEEGGSHDPAAVALACDVPGRLAGRKLFVRDAGIAHDLIVAARVGPGGDLRLLVLPADRPGIARLPLDAIGGEGLCAVTFDAVAVGPGDVLDGPGSTALAAALQAGALARTAEMVGAAQRVLELAVDHARTRVQGGQPIGSYQAIQHQCADLVRDVDASRGLVRAAAWTAAGCRPAAADTAMAKAFAAEACLAAARRGHQILGALAYCEEHPMHRLHARILAASRDCGDAGLHLEAVARAIGLA
jgi:alkylation response protein AidB-like acyl-CoA dehydrogenase